MRATHFEMRHIFPVFIGHGICGPIFTKIMLTLTSDLFQENVCPPATTTFYLSITSDNHYSNFVDTATRFRPDPTKDWEHSQTLILTESIILHYTVNTNR